MVLFVLAVTNIKRANGGKLCKAILEIEAKIGGKWQEALVDFLKTGNLSVIYFLEKNFNVSL